MSGEPSPSGSFDKAKGGPAINKAKPVPGTLAVASGEFAGERFVDPGSGGAPHEATLQGLQVDPGRVQVRVVIESEDKPLSS